jgi:hypothetical protein
LRIEEQEKRLTLNEHDDDDDYEIMWKNVVGMDRPQMTIYYGTCTLCAG